MTKKIKTRYFETIKLENGVFHNLFFHEKRIYKTIKLRLNLTRLLSPPKILGLVKCKVIYDENGVLEISYLKYKKREIQTFKVIFCDDISYDYKFLDRSKIDELFKQKKDCDEILIFKNSFLSDTSIANIAVKYGNIWYTPRLALFEGITRARLLKEGKLKEKDLNLDFIKKAQSLALMNAMIGFDIISNFKIKE